MGTGPFDRDRSFRLFINGDRIWGQVLSINGDRSFRLVLSIAGPFDCSQIATGVPEEQPKDGGQCLPLNRNRILCEAGAEAPFDEFRVNAGLGNRPMFTNVAQCASSQLAPVPISTITGTSSFKASCMVSLILGISSSASASQRSKTSSS